MDPSRFIQQLRMELPETTHPWVIQALKQDPLVWQTLTSSDLAEKALSACKDQPQAWNPGRLSLLALDANIIAEDLSTTPLVPLMPGLKQKASGTYESLAKGSKSLETLAEAGLAALALRERYRLVGSWDHLSQELLSKPGGHFHTWSTPLACLLGFLADPLQLISALIYPGAPIEAVSLALHAFLSQPAPSDELLGALEEIIVKRWSPAHRIPVEVMHLIQILSRQHHKIAQDLCLRLVETGKLEELEMELDPERLGLEQMVENIQLAEIYQTAGQTGHAFEILGKNQQAARWLQANLAALQAAMAEESQWQAAAQIPSEKIVEAWTQAVEWTPVLFRQDGVSPFQAQLDHAKQKAQDGETLLKGLSHSSDREPADSLPEAPGILFAAAQTAQKAGDPVSAGDYARQALKRLLGSEPQLVHSPFEPLQSTDLRNQQHELRALTRLFYVLGLYEPCIEAAQAYLAVDPNHTETNFIQGKAFQALFDYQAANQALQAALMLAPERLEIETRLAEGMEAAGDWLGALAERQKILTKLSSDQTESIIEAEHALAECAIQAGKPEIASLACERALSLDPEDGLAYVYLGEVEFENEGNPERLWAALGYFNQAIQYAPQAAESWLGLVKAYQGLDQTEKANEVLKEAVQAAPLSAEVHFALGKVFQDQGLLTQAAETLGRAYHLAEQMPISGQKYNWQIPLRLGQVMAQLGHVQEAHAIFEKTYHLPQLRGNKPPTLAHAFAKSLLSLDQTSQAIPVLKEALQAAPEDTALHLDYARALLFTGTNPLEAVQVLQAAITKSPNLHEGRALLAEAFYAAGDHPNALKLYQECLDTMLAKDRKWVARLSYGMGCSALALHLTEPAIAALQESIHADPSLPACHQKLCEAYWEADLGNNAIQAARSALNLDIENPETLLWYAEQAIRFYQANSPKDLKAFAANPCEDSQPERLYGIKPRQVLAEAMNALTQASQLTTGSAKIFLKLGELQVLAGEKAQAAKTFSQMLSVDSLETADLQRAADWLTQLGEHEGAANCLERALSLVKAQGNLPPYDLFDALALSHWRTKNNEKAQGVIEQAIAAHPQQVQLYLKAAQIQLDSNQVEQAVAQLQEALEVLQNPHDQAEIHYHLAQIHRSRGELQSSTAHAETACEFTPSAGDPVHADWQYLAKRLLASELKQALLQIKPARAIMELPAQPTIHTVETELQTAQAIEALAGFHCQKAELALEDDEEIEAANALTAAVQVAPTHPRSLALQTRLQHRRGDDSLAQRTLEEALRQLPIAEEWGGCGLGNGSGFQAQYQTFALAATFDKGAAAADYLSLAEAAVELSRWELALHLVEQAISGSPHEPYPRLALASIVVRRAEREYLAQQLDVVKHAPGEKALSAGQAQYFWENLEAARQALPSDSAAAGPDLLQTWEIRGRAVFQQAALPERDTALSASEAGVLDWAALPETVETGAAELAYWIRQAAEEQEAARIRSPFFVQLTPLAKTCAEKALQAAQHYPGSILVLLLAGLALETSQPERALEWAKKAVKIHKPVVSDLAAMSHALLARLAYQLNDQQEALRAIDTALSIWQDEPRWHALAAAIGQQINQESEETLEHLDAAVQLEPDHYAHHINLGLAHLQHSNEGAPHIQGAIRSFETASRISPECPKAWIQLAKARLLDGDCFDLAQAASLADRAIALSLEEQNEEYRLPAWLLRAEIALRAGDAGTAYDYSEKAQRVSPNHSEAIWLKAKALEGLNRPAEALSILEKANLNAIEPLHFQIKRIDLINQTQGAEAALKPIRALAGKHPQQPAVLSLLAQILFDAGLKEEALQAAQLALKFYPIQPELNAAEKTRLHYMIGMQSVNAGQLDHAIHHLNEAIHLTPGFIEPYLEAGFAYNKQRQYLKAQKLFEQATLIAPDDPRPFMHAGLSLKEGKNYLSAEAMLRRAAQLAPADVQIRKHLAAVAALNLVHNPHNLQVAAER